MIHFRKAYIISFIILLPFLSFLFPYLSRIQFDNPEAIVHHSLNTDYVKITVTYNAAPSISSGPSDGNSTSSTPTNVGSDVTFSATSTDAESNSWKLLVCKTSSAPTASTTTPTCSGGSSNLWCVSSSWASSTNQNTCTYTALVGDVESNVWYAFSCDNNAAPNCSTSSQGSGDSGSPFNVNHSPTITSIGTTPTSIDPGATVTFTATSSDTDTDPSADTVKLLVCKTSGLSGTTCTGDTWCGITSLVASNPSCTSTAPTAAGSNSYYVYVLDNHSLSATATSSTFTVNNATPSVGVISVGSVSLSESSTTTATSSVTVSDNNGCTNIASITAVFYDSNATSATCGQNNNSCYASIACSTSTCDGNDSAASCTAYPWYYANASNGWKWQIKATDSASASSTNTSGTTTIAALIALEVNETTINYGTGLLPGATSSQATTTIENTGNTNLDVDTYGTAMSCTAGTIAVGQQKFNTGGGETALTGVAQTIDLNVAQRITTVPTGSVYWKLYAPTNIKGTCSGTNTFEAKNGG